MNEYVEMPSVFVNKAAPTFKMQVVQKGEGNSRTTRFIFNGEQFDNFEVKIVGEWELDAFMVLIGDYTKKLKHELDINRAMFMDDSYINAELTEELNNMNESFDELIRHFKEHRKMYSASLKSAIDDLLIE